ncbi:MAG: hypothetical protein H6Q71_885 [Firmicutes bacterium]|nr:hypothetical protein [Bacillota bacterium]
MSRIKFSSKIIMVCLMTMLFSVCSVGSAMATINDDHKELVVKAYENLLALKSYLRYTPIRMVSGRNSLYLIITRLMNILTIPKPLLA